MPTTNPPRKSLVAPLRHNRRARIPSGVRNAAPEAPLPSRTIPSEGTTKGTTEKGEEGAKGESPAADTGVKVLTDGDRSDGPAAVARCLLSMEWRPSPMAGRNHVIPPTAVFQIKISFAGKLISLNHHFSFFRWLVPLDINATIVQTGSPKNQSKPPKNAKPESGFRNADTRRRRMCRRKTQSFPSFDRPAEKQVFAVMKFAPYICFSLCIS